MKCCSVAACKEVEINSLAGRSDVCYILATRSTIIWAICFSGVPFFDQVDSMPVQSEVECVSCKLSNQY